MPISRDRERDDRIETDARQHQSEAAKDTETRGDHLRRRLRSLQILRHRLRRDHRQRDVHGAQAAKAIQDKLNRLDEAFLFDRSIDIETYDRHAEKLREELTLARIDRHSGQLEELDVEGILAFAERILPRASDLWVQASLNQRQRFQQLFFPGGIAFDGNRFIGTGVTAPAFSYLREIRTGNEGLVDLTGIEPVTS